MKIIQNEHLNIEFIENLMREVIFQIFKKKIYFIQVDEFEERGSTMGVACIFDLIETDNPMTLSNHSKRFLFYIEEKKYHKDFEEDTFQIMGMQDKEGKNLKKYIPLS